jgi:hypothetical protein
VLTVAIAKLTRPHVAMARTCWQACTREDATMKDGMLGAARLTLARQ